MQKSYELQRQIWFQTLETLVSNLYHDWIPEEKWLYIWSWTALNEALNQIHITFIKQISFGFLVFEIRKHFLDTYFANRSCVIGTRCTKACVRHPCRTEHTCQLSRRKLHRVAKNVPENIRAFTSHQKTWTKAENWHFYSLSSDNSEYENIERSMLYFHANRSEYIELNGIVDRWIKFFTTDLMLFAICFVFISSLLWIQRSIQQLAAQIQSLIQAYRCCTVGMRNKRNSATSVWIYTVYVCAFLTNNQPEVYHLDKHALSESSEYNSTKFDRCQPKSTTSLRN